MPNDDRARVIYRRTPESAAMVANVKRAMAITAKINRLTFDDSDQIRALFGAHYMSIITSGHPLEPSRRRSTTIGKTIVIGKNVWIAAGAIVIGARQID